MMGQDILRVQEADNGYVIEIRKPDPKKKSGSKEGAAVPMDYDKQWESLVAEKASDVLRIVKAALDKRMEKDIRKGYREMTGKK